MLHGVLNMPPNLWSDDALDVCQRHQYYLAASKKIERLSQALNDLIAQIDGSDGTAQLDLDDARAAIFE
jgi:hypothetical protein